LGSTLKLTLKLAAKNIFSDKKHVKYGKLLFCKQMMLILAEIGKYAKTRAKT
jgi:hypothetical protein